MVADRGTTFTMTLVRMIARPMMASLFVWSGVRVLRNPEPVLPKAEPVAERVKPLLQKASPQIPTDPKTLVRINAGLHVVGGTMFALGWAPRISSLLLAGSMVPTTVAGHPFWEYSDKAERNNQLNHFIKNVAITGGLLIAGVDTEGKPGISWRAQRASKDARRAAKTARREARLAAKAARAQVSAKARGLVPRS
jgi:putative oxidoreductase